MTFLIITALILIPTFLFLFIGGKVRDKFVFEKVGNEEIVDVNDAVKFLRRNEKKRIHQWCTLFNESATCFL